MHILTRHPISYQVIATMSLQVSIELGDSAFAVQAGHQVEDAAFWRHAGKPPALLGQHYPKLLARYIIDDQPRQDSLVPLSQVRRQVSGRVPRFGRFLSRLLSRYFSVFSQPVHVLPSFRLSAGDIRPSGFDQFRFYLL